jgi:phosphate transport system substrate-binding protein
MQKTFRFGWGFVLLILSLAAVGGCGAKKSRLSVAGSTSVQPIAEMLAEDYLKKHPQAVVNVQGGGSSAGIKAAKDGTVAVGMSSRELTPEEAAGLTVVEIARDGIAMIIHPENNVTNLTLDQLRDIYSGKINNWAQVGGNNAAILVVNREAGSGTRGAFTEIVMGETSLAKTIVQGSTGAVRQTVSGDRNAIGYISLAALDSKVKALRVNGAACDVAAIKAQKYQVVRPFVFVYKKPGSPEVKEWIKYVLNEGQKIIVANGLIAIK